MQQTTTRVVVRVALGAALVTALIAATAQMRGTWMSVEHRHSVAQSDRRDARAVGVNPAVLAHIAAAIPPRAAYAVEVARTLSRSDHGQAFLALLRGSLLPRIQVGAGEARWLVLWGEQPRSGSSSRTVGLVHRGEPSVVLVENAR